ncbi:MAG: dockerin type I domain-containing protein [Oscillospiraceae bacterium]|nr:dockerin type I domain-containing protein [Oscillospiraceae bacterium]
MNFKFFNGKALAFASALAISLSTINVFSNSARQDVINAVDSVEMEWDTLRMGGAGFVSGIVTGQKEMYLRTDVGGCYRYDYDKNRWVQIFDFITDADRGLLSCKGIAIDPTDDMTAYFLCGCAYFSNARTVIFKTTDGGKTFTEVDVTEHIQVHGNGDGRECIEPIAVDPDDPNTIYAGGDVTYGKSALIKSTDGGKTWNPVMGYDELGLFTGDLLYPSWTDHKVRSTEPDKLYNQQNGIGCVYIEGGKVYVGTSVTGKPNIHVASVKDDKFEPIEALPNENYPLSITSDHNGNLFFTYIGGLAFSGASGGAFKYNIKSGTVEQFDLKNSIGMIEADKNDPNKLFARTCGMWSDQWYGEEWTDDTIAWGDHFFRSADGGKTWEDITPGQGPTDYSTGTGVKKFISLPMDTNGYDWIYGKACHWGSGILIDPRDPEGDRLLLTSGNGVFACDNAWAEKDIQFYFQPDGVEECVSLDFVSVPGGDNYSAIGDYDGFIHKDKDSIPQQYQPNMGSTSAIAYCPSDPNVMARTAEGDGNNHGTGYYSLDAGKTWKTFEPKATGGKLSITETAKGKYRVFNTPKKGAAYYSDDWGKTWTQCGGINANYGTYTLVDLEDPKMVYAWGATYNEYWSSVKDKKEPTLEEAHYSFYVSNDYGSTFKETQVCMYGWDLTWMYEHTCDPAYIGKGTVAVAASNYGIYIFSENGTKMEHLDSMGYAKCIGYGAPEKAGGPNTLFVFGRPTENDPEGIYRSTDAGKSWVCINTDHLFGGTGNGNYICGDMNEFGTMYMSTVGCGIVVGKLSNGTVKPPAETTTTTKPVVTTKEPDVTTTKPVTTTPAVTTTTASNSGNEFLLGDVNGDESVDLSDLSTISLHILNEQLLTGNNLKAADVNKDGEVDVMDLARLKQYVSHAIKNL